MSKVPAGINALLYAMVFSISYNRHVIRYGDTEDLHKRKREKEIGREISLDKLNDYTTEKT